MEDEYDTVKVIRHKGKDLYYIQKMYSRLGSITKYCKEKLLKFVFERLGIDFVHFGSFDWMMTQRNSSGAADLLGNDNYVFFYEEDTLRCKREWIFGICIEERKVKKPQQIIQRIYFLGFIQSNILKKYCENVNHPIHTKDSTTTIQGFIPERTYFIVNTSIFQQKWEPKQEEEVQEVEVIPEVPVRTLASAKRNEPTLFLHIMHGNTIERSDMYDLMNIETECLEKVSLLWDLSIGITDARKKMIDSMRSTSAWHRDRRISYTLILLLCWDPDWMEWYIAAESLYIEIACESMFDMDDFIITLDYNKLRDRIPIYVGEFDRRKVTNDLKNYQRNKLMLYMNKLIENKEQSENMPKLMVNLMEKVCLLLSIKKTKNDEK
jgi:hypothetical protein